MVIPTRLNLIFTNLVGGKVCCEAKLDMVIFILETDIYFQSEVKCEPCNIDITIVFKPVNNDYVRQWYMSFVHNLKENKHNAELLQTDFGTKVTGEFSTKGYIFPPNAQIIFSLFP